MPGLTLSAAGAVGIFAFLLNFVWEFAQVPLFQGMAQAGHWRAIQVCARATLGDVSIALVAFWAVALTARSRDWMLRPTTWQVTGLVVVGVLITVVMEWLAIHALPPPVVSAGSSREALRAGMARGLANA